MNQNPSVDDSHEIYKDEKIDSVHKLKIPLKTTIGAVSYDD